MTQCTLALAQIESSCLDQRGNLEKMIAYARRAEEAGADLLCFPEGALTGYCTERAREFALPLDSTPCLRLAALARELGLLIAVGLLERAPDGRVFITQMLCRPDGIHRFYRKTHLGGKEAGWISAGDRLPVFETAQGVIGMAVCYDTHYPALVETLSLKGAELVLAPFASPKDSLRRETWMKYLPARAYDNRVYLGCCNLVGGNGIGGHFSGGTVLFDPDGEVVCENFSQEETLLTARISPALLKAYRGGEPSVLPYRYFPAGRRTALYQ